jgi:hypothetical protein
VARLRAHRGERRFAARRTRTHNKSRRRGRALVTPEPIPLPPIPLPWSAPGPSKQEIHGRLRGHFPECFSRPGFGVHGSVNGFPTGTFRSHKARKREPPRRESWSGRGKGTEARELGFRGRTLSPPQAGRFAEAEPQLARCRCKIKCKSRSKKSVATSPAFPSPTGQSQQLEPTEPFEL